MNNTAMEEFLTGLLYEDENIKSISTFGEAGLLTRNKGLVVRFENGDEFQLTIVQSQYGKDDSEDDDNEY